MARKTTIFTLLLLLPTLLVGGCSDDPNAIPSGLVYCSEGNPESFNPQRVTSGTTIDATSHQLYDRLITFDANHNYQPALATKWSVSEDGLTYRFHLRQGVAFHSSNDFKPSRFFNADDVLFSFDRVRQLDHPFYPKQRSNFPFFESVQFAQQIRHIKAISPYLVEFKLKLPDVTFLANIATDFAVILSAQYAQQLLAQGHVERIDQFPIGTGPFKLKKYAKNHYIRYQRFDEHWRGPAKTENLVFDISPNSTVRLSKLITGECDIAALPNVQEIDKMAARGLVFPEVIVENQQGLNVSFWAINTRKPPFNDRRVRQALAHAINKSRIFDVVYNRQAIESQSLLPPFSAAFSPSDYRYRYDPEKAKALLEETGFSDLSMDIWAMPVARAYNPNSYKTAELIQADLLAIGIDANIVSFDWSVFNQKLASGDYDSVVIGWTADNVDPDNFFTPLLSCNSVDSGNNRARWCNATFDWKINQARQESDFEIRKSLYQDAENIVAVEVPVIGLAHTTRKIARRANLKGLQLSSYGGLSLAQAYKQMGQAPEPGETELQEVQP
ncbi:ABC transporter substrate-binding protein [Paraferrimonas haliotis]|uniref:ABC transporter substrate-binding protein n=1 Tax=Paraferrimonas haliotis TaxID=2013866 RepID=UPI000BA8FB9E|nr:ABC transporter substrate-binding protein [Paraferrimonas haliotis]